MCGERERDEKEREKIEEGRKEMWEEGRVKEGSKEEMNGQKR